MARQAPRSATNGASRTRVANVVTITSRPSSNRSPVPSSNHRSPYLAMGAAAWRKGTKCQKKGASSVTGRTSNGYSAYQPSSASGARETTHSIGPSRFACPGAWRTTLPGTAATRSSKRDTSAGVQGDRLSRMVAVTQNPRVVLTSTCRSKSVIPRRRKASRAVAR